MKKFYKHPKFTAVFTDKDGYFSFTGNVGGGSGAVGDRIAKIDPQFAPLNAMHLSDAKTGEPMHARANAEYFAREIRNSSDRYTVKTIIDHLRCSETEAKEFQLSIAFLDDTLKNGDNNTFQKTQAKVDAFFVNLASRWQKEADEVRDIAMSIESNLCGSFVNPMAGDGLYISEEYKNDLDDLDEDDRRKRVALAKFLDIDVLNVEGEGYDYDATGRWYLVLTDEEADEKAQKCIESSAWAFNSGFLAGFTGMPAEMFEAVHDKCEGANDAVLRCIEMAGGIERFAKRAIHADGRGHFLSSYDGREDEEEMDGVTYYIYIQ